MVVWVARRRERSVGQAKKSRAMGWVVEDCEKLGRVGMLEGGGWMYEEEEEVGKRLAYLGRSQSGTLSNSFFVALR